MLRRHKAAVLTLAVLVAAAGSLAVVTAGATGEDVQSSLDPTDVTVVEPGESIQAAIDSADPGDTIEIRTGTYEESLEIDKRLTIEAEDGTQLDGVDVDESDGVIITADETAVRGLEVLRFEDAGVSVEASDVTIEDVRVRLNGGSGLDADTESADRTQLVNVTADENGERGFVANGAVTVESSAFIDNDNSGISLYDATDVSITDSEFLRNNYGVLVREGESVTVESSEFVQNDQDGIDIRTDVLLGRTVKVTDSVIRLNSGTGLNVDGTADPDEVTVADSRISENGDEGVLTERVESVTIDDAVVEDNGDEGILVNDADSVSVTNVTAADNDRHVEITGGSDREILIENVTAERNSGFNNHGIRVRDVTSSGTATVKNVLVTDSTASGLVLHEESITVENVTSNANSDAGIDVTGTDVSIDDAVVEDNGDEGILVNDADSVSVTNVTAADNDDRHVEITGGSDREILIENVTAERNSGFNDPGIRVRDVTSSGTATVKNVLVTDSVASGLVLNEESITVENVTSNANSDVGIDVTGTDVSIDDAVVEDNGNEGILVTDADSVSVTNVTAADNNDRHVEITGGSDREILIENVTAERNSGGSFSGSFGIWVHSGGGDGTLTVKDLDVTESTNSGLSLTEESITVQRVTTTGNDGDGLEVDGNDVSIDDAVVSDNGGAGILFESVGDAAIVRNSSLTDGSPLLVNEDEGEVDARENWWGSAAGPSDDDIVGDVDVTDPLASSPHVDDPGAPSVSDYASDDGTVGLTGVLDAINDYSDGTIELTVVLEAIGAYGSGAPV